MALREAADHEQTHAAGDGDVHGGRRGEPLVDRGEVLGGEADAGVVDLDEHAAVGQRMTGHLDLGLRRGERGRVLEQLGEQVHEVVDDASRDLGGGHRRQLDALVLLHLGRGGTQHVDERHGPGPATAGLFTGEHEEVLAVTAHAGREVVELEQRGELVRVGLAGLQLGDEGELALDEALGTAREVGEHRVDVAPQEGLLGGEADGLAVHVVEGRGHLADLVPGVHTDRLHGRVHVLRVGLGELLDQLGQAVLGDLGGGVLQPPQRADHGPGHDEGADERHTEHEQDERTVEDRLLLGLVPERTGLLLHLVEQRQLDLGHLRDLGGVGVHPVLVGALAAELDAAFLLQDALGVGVGGLDGGVALADGLQELLGVTGVDPVEGLELRALLVKGGERVPAVGLGELAELAVVRGQRGRDDGALHGGVLLGGGERGERAGALDHVRVAGRLRHVLGEREELLDELAVGVDGLRDRLGVGVRVPADVVDLLQLLGDLDGALPDAQQALVAVAVVELLRAPQEVLVGAVRVVPGALDGEVGVLRVVRERARRLVALLLERRGQLGGLLGHVGQQLHVVELLDLVHRRVDPQGAEGGRRDDGQREERDQTGGDAPVAQGYSGAGTRRCLGALGQRSARGRAGARAAGTRAAVTGLHLSGVLGVLGRGAAVTSAALRIRRSFPSAAAGLGRPLAIPLETSLH
ncbi:hypothetical protein STRAU_3444 [Streptomyces aurantiacus JA 4570]|uniref:Uncharacterized protein n=1 Tax=Streptomyces aurantiacus JA 4570 TaxID=1286094 RepID=S3ZL20_9ACTN|nr:hypothetical protein STRAU_3444 [Streptomyces aurantiacus JA 4570]